MARDPKDAESGWCVYAYEHEQAPELEVLCGGVNSKTPRAAAVWRQGHLLHFGFATAPDGLTEAGQALLVNAVCYIARFTEDRPIVRTADESGRERRIFDRGAVGRLVENPRRDLKDLAYYVGQETYPALAGKSRDEVGAWYREVGDFLHADAEGRLVVDAEARQFGVPTAGNEFLARAAAALDDPGLGPLARRLLGRYAPGGPGAGATAARWQAWVQENRPYLFFSDAGGFRWYLDPLAKKRGVPTGMLRGPERATRHAFTTTP